MKVALLQLCATEDKTVNLKKALAMSRQALDEGAKFVLLPEVFNYRAGGGNKEAYIRAAEKIPGPSTRAFLPLAQQHKAVFLLGSIIEKAPGSMVYNTSLLVNAQGQITAKYRKIHLFDARLGDKAIKEGAIFKAGRRGVTAEAGGLTAGLSICYDLRFGGLYQNYARRGADLLTVPSCFTKKTGAAHWEVLLRARAIENLCYVLAPNQVGTLNKALPAYGHSMIVDPWGEVLACAGGEAEEIVFGEIGAEAINKARAMLPGIIR